MSVLHVSFAPVPSAEIPANAGPFFVDAVYTRSVDTPTSKELADLPKAVQETVRGTLDGRLSGSVDLPDVAAGSSIDLNFLGGTGAVRLRKTVPPPGGDAVAIQLSSAEVSTITAPDPQPAAAPPQATRWAYFVPVNDQRVPFESSQLQIAPVRTAGGGWSTLGLGAMFHSDSPSTTSVQWAPALLSQTPAVQWTPIHVAVDGQFNFTLPAASGDAWLWWLSGPMPAIGVVMDDLSVPRVARIAVPLPPFSAGAPADGGPGRVPTDPTETEVANNPLVYTEDPGEFCKPFSNPERVLGERSFFVIFRVEQPVISAEASVRKDPLPVLTSVMATAAREALETAPATTTTARSARAATLAGAAAPVRGTIAPGTLVAGDTEAAFLRHGLPGAYLDVLRSYDRGRTEMDAAHPVQWEGDSSRYQATTVARGHILEFRMRWRSNGYSLGTVAKTLTLAPRQARRIEKIEWSRTEMARREESTRLVDQVSDTLARDRDYDDSVQANLSEWARGESSSNMVAGAAGAGFVIPPFVVGGGGGASHASSSSSQQGGRDTSASEEQRLRDSIRRYGDSLRKLDSLVVNEVTQEETATGTTEVVRNLNYGHSLTVIYYQILRHLKIETVVAGVRECLFVPFAITPFTAVRAYRWREAIQKRLRDAQYAEAIRYLRDVVTNFAASNVPPGPRSLQPVRFIRGSLFMSLAVDRPRDKDDGSFDAAPWVLVQPFIGVPALGIFQMLHSVDEAQRDAVFQKQHAGKIAAGWVNTLKLDIGGKALPADFTLATRYQFNGVARVDFNVAVPAGMNVTRETLSALHLMAGKPLPPGSVANLQSASFTYQTDNFQRTVSATSGTDDLIDVETGDIDPNGALATSIPDEWERRDVRLEMTNAVQGLVEHLNEHVEYYHKAVWWEMDRDRLFMLIDGFYIPGTNQVSIASVVEREPIAIIGNAIVYRVSAGSFLGLGSIKTPADLLNYYIGHDAPTEPMLVSLPTDGLYAQTVMDECAAIEEHFGNTDWVLNDPDPTLSEIAPELLASRRAEPQGTTPTTLPPTLINLQNAPEAPAPSGLAGALAAVTTPNAFRDMAGLAGTQANAAAAFQTAASLAQNFGNQAAALKLAELAKNAHATQTADQKLATVQRALDKGLTTPAEAQRQTAQILGNMSTPASTPPVPQAAAATHAIFAASSQTTPWSVEYQDLLGSTKVSSGGGASQATATSPQPAPAPMLDTRLEGIDIFDSNSMPSAADLDTLGISFVLHKSSDGAGHLDTKYTTRKNDCRSEGILFGAYHFMRSSETTANQINQAFGVIERIRPGEFGPSVDFEHASWNDPSLGLNSPLTPDQWIAKLSDYMDGLETALGRQPMVYTSWQVWNDGIDTDDTDPHHAANPLAKAAAMDRFKDYPLWVKMYYDPPADRFPNRTTRQPSEIHPLPSPWSQWVIWQYDDHAPATLAGLDAGTDMNVSNGTIYDLRALADLGHTAPHLVGNLNVIALTDPGGGVRVLELVSGSWRNIDALAGIASPPLAAGDPASIGLGNEQILVYRSKDDHVRVLTRSVTDTSTSINWSPADITGSSNAVGDPSVIVFGNAVHVFYWDASNAQRHLTRAGTTWQEEGLVDSGGVNMASGNGIAYVHQNALHVVSRAGRDGHLFDFTAPAGTGQQDLTAGSHDGNGAAPPAATYRPAIYTPTGSAPRIVFRAVRGDIWQIERDTLLARNLSLDAGHAPPAAGSPAALFAGNAHVFYRTLGGTIIDIYDDAGTWRRRNVCTDAAADPSAYCDDAAQPVVTYLGSGGTIRVARFSNGSWTCEDAG